MSNSKKREVVYSIGAILLGAILVFAFSLDYMGYGFGSFDLWVDGVMLFLAIIFFIAGLYVLTHLPKGSRAPKS